MASTVPSVDTQALEAYLAHLDFDSGQTVTDQPHHQGEVRLFHPQHPQLPQALIIKRAKGQGLRYWLSLKTLQREHAAYQRLGSMPGIPLCFGLFQSCYLVLEYIDGEPLSHPPKDPQVMQRLLETIQAMHQKGVAHGDLKRKENLLITPTREIVLIDLGTALIKKVGFHPIQHQLFRFLAQTDLNAWIKHKYGGYEGVSDQDRPILRRSWPERVLAYWRSFKRAKP